MRVGWREEAGGTWREQESGRVPEGGRGVLQKYFSVFARCSQSFFLYLYGVLEGERHGAVLLSLVR